MHEYAASVLTLRGFRVSTGATLRQQLHREGDRADVRLGRRIDDLVLGADRRPS